ncbi:MULTISPECIES: hypothetical protein [Pseudomonadaceae]|uniref:hypothetical protein n=1 Tax=Pseudomonadaceae TaxID=135621 RepID=UPI0015E49514|nr:MULTISPECIES: hypothetical protein [Pseudomonadaceae]MBA1280560.1 hypothetical protein [Stutzerimonas stutzeri]MBH8610663.1 hypothetical protein [Pseudomonas mohnii]
MTCNAFELTTIDIECVLLSHSERMINTHGLSIVRLAEELFDEIDHERIEQAALAASTDTDAQTNAAFAEIKDNLVELGVLEF